MLKAMFDQGMLLFTIPALLGTAVFLLRLGLMALGGDGGGADGHADVHVDVGGGADGHGDSTEAFKLVSVQSVAAFLMGFGWGGLGARLGLGWTLPGSLLLGGGFGAALVWLLGVIMKGVYDLESSGNISIDQTMGAEGSVYARIPCAGSGRGQVRVVIGERARIYNAVSQDDEISTGTRIRVVRVNDDQTVTVTAA
jgi:hypothetical protein